jgi:hypothetical protein
VPPFFLKLSSIPERIHLLSFKTNQFYTQIFTSPKRLVKSIKPIAPDFGGEGMGEE